MYNPTKRFHHSYPRKLFKKKITELSPHYFMQKMKVNFFSYLRKMTSSGHLLLHISNIVYQYNSLSFIVQIKDDFETNNMAPI